MAALCIAQRAVMAVTVLPTASDFWPKADVVTRPRVWQRLVKPSTDAASRSTYNQVKEVTTTP